MDREEEHAGVTLGKFDAVFENPEADVWHECSYVIWFRVATMR